jgi:hypothetical protein
MQSPAQNLASKSIAVLQTQNCYPFAEIGTRNFQRFELARLLVRLDHVARLIEYRVPDHVNG